ncbi:putative protein N(5)-glutamine methyltransferase [Agromyces sp. NPDC058064]|uniref:putative protein N(5)-glutamine methyltransferase n=1 Tax=Agromyces sp. NPDC058064 TaxID=3346322 RepID=UPI0036DBF4AF
MPAADPADPADPAAVSTDASGNEALVARLRAAGCVFAEDEAALLVAASRDPARVEELVARRTAGEPLEALLGWAEFAGLRLDVEPGVFVPRHRTEALAVEAARRAVRATERNGSPAVVVDLCCGVGAIGAVVADTAAPVVLLAADVDPAAVRAARRNLEPRGARVFEGDLYDALPAEFAGRVDVLAVNAPYVPSGEIAFMPPEARDHEARIALDGGADGLDVHRRVAASAVRWLAPGGSLVIETSEHQAGAAARLMGDAGLEALVVADDDATLVIGTRPSA